ncbi:prion-like-(Q/N-rich) domain-bearing protein 25 isoform X2 [Macrobrachium rosenbergii]|uniref:prion-like-(Q/N-rich) domain-bearing protein 25 isoform X2 n=1 Tax=Macrobrachium rosenbergii TaxID=79674 RepID=UPI0034D3E113
MKWIISSLQCLLLLMYADSLEVGDICSSSDQCGDLKECRFGRCTCSDNANMIPVFSSISTQSGTICSEKKKCDYTVKPRKLCSHGSCILEKGQFYGLCSCDESSLLTVNYISNKTCWPYRRIGFNEICGHCFPMCDEFKGLVCRLRHCLCKRDDVYDFEIQGCISRQSYMEKFNLTEYRGRWGDYCFEDEDCLDMLECGHNRTCQCSSDCYGYIEEYNSCYCGDYEFPTGPVVVGILLGFVIICFWCYQIDKLCKKHQVRPAEPARYEIVQEREDELQPIESHPDDTLPQYDVAVASDDYINDAIPAPSAPPLLDDHICVNKQPVPLRKRKLQTSTGSHQHMKM